MRLLLVALAASAVAVPAFAQQPGVPAPEAAAAGAVGPVNVDPRINQLIVYGEDPCPASTNDEIIVCARLPENDRYRIPERLRRDPNDPDNQGWAARAMELSYVGATGIGSCSTTGPGGHTGCFNQIVQQARAERAGAPDINWNDMIERARRERLRRIGEAALEEEDPPAQPD